MSLYRILCTDGPSWIKGEDEKDAIPRRLLPDKTTCDVRYPWDFAGKIISVIPFEKRYHAKDLAASNRREVILDLSDVDLARARSGQYKLLPATEALADVTFEDRYGAIAHKLLRFNPDATVTTEEDEQVEIDIVWERNDLFRRGYDAQLREWKELSAKAVVAMEPFNEPRPIAPLPEPLPEPSFAFEVTRLKRRLPRVVVHSGAGLYEVGPGKTYSTIQSALDQLWTDQGSATFTAAQYIRIFAGSYDENVVPNAGLVPNTGAGFDLVVEGDPADDRDNIDVAPSSGSYVFDVNCDSIVLRHMKIAGAPAARCVYCQSACDSVRVFDCWMEPSTGVNILYAYNACLIEDSVLISTQQGLFAYVCSAVVRRCRFEGGGKGTGTGIYLYRGAGIIESSVFHNLGIAVDTIIERISGVLLANCLIYNATAGLEGPALSWKIINTIFSGVDVIFNLDGWPEITSTRFGPDIVQRNNCFYGYNFFATVEGARKSFAEWIALSEVDAAGDLDATDPKLTDPDNGDFSLHADSPCRHAGHGSGVVTGRNGVAFDEAYPDIGAWSSGVIPAAVAPTWTDNLSNIAAVDPETGGDVDLTWDAALAPGYNVGYIVERRTTVGPGAWGEIERSNDTSMRASGGTNGTSYDWRVKAYTRVQTEPTTIPADTATATPTTTSEPNAPTITAVVDDKTGTSVTLTIDADNEADVISIRYEIVNEDTWTLFGSTRTGDGDLQITGLTTELYTMIATAHRNGLNSLPSDPVFVRATTGVPPLKHAGIYTALKQVLINNNAITALVPATNIRPSEDPSEPAAGNAIVYNWQAGRWDFKSRRGEGVLIVQVGAVDNKLIADQILDLVRDALSARALSYAGSPIRVHQFREDGAFADAGTTDSDRFQAATSYQVRMIEAPDG